VAELNPPGAVVELASKLEQAGFETWCVGGAVRDALLGVAGLDWDLATAARPEQVRGVFGARRTIPVGIEFGTVGVLDASGQMHEVTTFRHDLRTDGRHAEVAFGASLTEDLARRDFTINAIAWHPLRHEIRDPFGGREDLRARMVRAVGDPAARMREDRLRALRAIRFAGRFDFEIELATWRAITESAAHLGRLSPERVRQELQKTMEQVRCPSVTLARWRDAGAFATVLPPLGDVSDDVLRVLDHLAPPGLRGRPQRTLLRFAALFAACPPEEVRDIVDRLRFSRQEGGWVALVVSRWAAAAPMLERLAHHPRQIPDGDVRRLASTIGRLNIAPVMRLTGARWSARRGRGSTAPPPAAVRLLHRRLLASAYRDALDLRDLALDGDDLRRAGIPPGPLLGKILHALVERVVEDPAFNVPDRLLVEARRMHDAHRLGQA